MELYLPPGMIFTRLTAAAFAELEQQWTDECASFGEDFSQFAAPSIEHAKKIASEQPADPRYGIFALQHDGKHEIIVHLNRASLPGTTGHTLRVNWALAAPRYDFAPLVADEIGPSVVGLFIGILQTAQTTMGSRYVKVHLGSMPDRSIFSGMAHGLAGVGAATDVSVRGNWLHLTIG